MEDLPGDLFFDNCPWPKVNHCDFDKRLALDQLLLDAKQNINKLDIERHIFFSYVNNIGIK